MGLIIFAYNYRSYDSGSIKWGEWRYCELAEMRPVSMTIEDKTEMVELAFNTLGDIIYTRSDNERLEFLGTLQEIVDRYHDPEFRLAVIGNFSCGKSTFLNALLERDLLAMSDLPTTAIPTYIRWDRDAAAERKAASFFQKKHVPGEDSPTVTVTLLNGEEYLLYGKRLKQFEKSTGLHLPTEPGKMIDFITTTTKLAESIKSVKMSFPFREKFENFCLIDTPGVNPGEEENKEHIVQTQSVLRDEADVAIVLYTAKDAMSRDTREFLEENADHLMKDAIIMLTKMDLVPDRQRDKLQKNTARLVGNQFGQENPTVYMISAGRALDYFCGYDKDQETREESRDWAQQFDTTIDLVLTKLHERRVDIVAHRITQLMSDLIDNISDSINNETATLQNEAEQLRNASFENLEKEIQVICDKFQQEIERDKDYRQAQMREIIRQQVEAARDDICDRISNTSNQDELNSCLQNYYPARMKKASEEIDNRVRVEVIGGIRSLGQRYTANVESCLESYQRKLGSVSTLSINAIDASMGSSSVNLDVSAPSFVGNHAGLLAGGAAVLLFGAFAPVALIGGFLLDRFRFAGRRDSAKEDVSQKAIAAIDDLSEGYGQGVVEAEEQYKAWAEQILENYVARYRREFEQIEYEHQNRELTVENVIKENTSYLNTMTTLKSQMAAL